MLLDVRCLCNFINKTKKFKPESTAMSQSSSDVFRPGIFSFDIDRDDVPKLEEPSEDELDEKRTRLVPLWRTEIDRSNSLVYYRRVENADGGPLEYRFNERLRTSVQAVIQKFEWTMKFRFSACLAPAGWLYYHLTRFLKVKPVVAEPLAVSVVKTYRLRDGWDLAVRLRNEMVTDIRLLFEFLQWPKPCDEPPEFLTRSVDSSLETGSRVELKDEDSGAVVQTRVLQKNDFHTPRKTKKSRSKRSLGDAEESSVKTAPGAPKKCKGKKSIVQSE